MHKVDIYPEQSLVVALFSGPVTIEEIKQANIETIKDSRFDKRFDGITDFRFAEASFTDHDLLQFRASALKSDFTRGAWCILASRPLETAMSMIFANKAQKTPIKVFSTVDAASAYLNRDLQQLLTQSPSTTRSALNSRIWRSTLSGIW
ncbi:MAG TPA: hypothetical protein VKA23_05680 [Mariprofundaceae bacterium]|nr:hypothetical protein [Mariprofundaceae bacterium]